VCPMGIITSSAWETKGSILLWLQLPFFFWCTKEQWIIDVIFACLFVFCTPFFICHEWIFNCKNSYLLNLNLETFWI
jgi:hypothetical protein